MAFIPPTNLDQLAKLTELTTPLAVELQAWDLRNPQRQYWQDILNYWNGLYHTNAAATGLPMQPPKRIPPKCPKWPMLAKIMAADLAEIANALHP